MRYRITWITAVSLACASCGVGIGDSSDSTDPTSDATTIEPIAKGGGTRLSHGSKSDVIANAGAQSIPYHNGPVMKGTTNVYYIWYGSWSGNTAQTILTDFMQNFGGSGYYNINTSYYDTTGEHVTNAVRFAGSTTDSYSHGTALSDADVRGVVSGALSANKLPTDSNGVYFVLTSADVDETSGFCTDYCGWHTFATLNGQNIKYAFVGNSARCLNTCAAQSTSPNGNAGADGMVSVVAHELEETTSDPNLNAWVDTSMPPELEENADKCAWTFGTTFPSANNSVANMHLGSRDYLIQQNWVNDSGGYCSLSYPNKETPYSIYAIPESRWQSVFNTVAGLGYRLTWFDGYDVNGQTFFNVVFVKNTSIPWVNFAGMDATTYQNTFNTWVGTNGYRLQQVASYRSGGVLRYAATFYKQPWPAWTAYHGVSPAQHQTNFNNLTAQGYRLVDQSLTDINGTVTVAALYDKVNVGGWVASFGMTAAQYQSFFTSSCANVGRSISYLDVYVSGGQPLFSAICDSVPVSAWNGAHGISAWTLQQDQETFHASGEATRLLVGYQNGSGASFGGIWAK
jgi:hypothetical protein